jgi:hypothetical protein
MPAAGKLYQGEERDVAMAQKPATKEGKNPNEDTQPHPKP